MKRNAILLVLALAFIVVRHPATAQLQGYFPDSSYDANVKEVSLLQLIATPAQYDGKRVRFVGFLRIEFEGNAIYLHREDFEYGISRNALWVDIPRAMTKQEKDSVNMHYVICAGVFRAGEHGHMGMFSGEVENVGRLTLWIDRARSDGPETTSKP